MDNEHLSPSSPPKASRIFRVLKRALLLVLILLILITGAGFIIGYYYQDEVKKFIIGELNKQLNSVVIVDGKDIDFTVVRNFPYASLDFRDVKMLDAGPAAGKDTLFKAGAISLQFNIVDIFHQNYHIKKIRLSDADLRIRIDKKGNDNYHFWKGTEDSVSTGFHFALEKIVLEGVRVSYRDKRERVELEALIRKSDLSGEFSSEKYSLQTNADLFISRFSSDSIVYLNKRELHAEIGLEVDQVAASYKISDGKVRIEDLQFGIFGNVISANKEQLVNLGIKGKDMDIRSVLSLIPHQYKKKIENYTSKGEFYFDATLRGSVSNGHYPVVKAEFGMRNAEISEMQDNIRLDRVNLKGYYFSGDKEEASVLELNKFSAVIEQGTISGDLKIRNLNAPSFSGHLQVNTSLAALQKLMKADTIENVTGMITMNTSFSSSGKDISSGNYEDLNATGDLSIRDATIKLKNNTLDFRNINGDFNFDNNDLVVNSFAGKVSGSDFALQGYFRNIFGFILKENEDISVEATLESEKIDLNELLANKEENGSGSKYKLKFSEHIDLNLKCRIDQLVFRKFMASEIRGILKLKDKKLSADEVKVTTMNGTITTSGTVDGTDPSVLLVSCFSEISRINVTKMFEQFENFGQASITDKNIKGVANAKINFISMFSPELLMDPDKLYSAIELSIENGELNNVEAMKSLSRFIELKELENIRFANMKNQIEIRNKVITIPKMEIRSNAMNIMLSGTHTFSNQIDYKVKLSLNELLSKKAKKAKKENDEFGEVADDGLGRTNIFLSMTGTVEHPVIRYDSRSAIQNVKQDLKVEKQNLRSILNEEFGLFKKDSALKRKETLPKEDQAKFRINWEEADKKESSKELKKPKKEEEEDF